MPSLTATIDDGIDGLRIGCMQRYFLEGSDPEVAGYTDAVIADLGQLGGIITDIDCPDIEHGSPSLLFFQQQTRLASMKRRSLITTGR